MIVQYIIHYTLCRRRLLDLDASLSRALFFFLPSGIKKFHYAVLPAAPYVREHDLGFVSIRRGAGSPFFFLLVPISDLRIALSFRFTKELAQEKLLMLPKRSCFGGGGGCYIWCFLDQGDKNDFNSSHPPRPRRLHISFRVFQCDATGLTNVDPIPPSSPVVSHIGNNSHE